LQGNYDDSPILIDSDGSEFGVADTDLLVNATTQLLSELNISRGDHILILSSGHLEAFITTWAAWLRGVVVIVLNPDLDDPQLNQIVSDRGVKLAFVDQRSQTEGRLDCEFVLFDDMQSSQISPDLFSARLEPYFDRPGDFTDDISATDTALILATSGSSGTPKQVALSHGALFRSGALLAHGYTWLPGERLLSLGPFYSMSGLRNPVVAALHSGTTIVISSRAQQNSFPATLKIIDETKVNIVTTVPAFIENLLTFKARSDLPSLPSLRLILSTASKLDSSLREELSTELSADIADYYGLTETCGICIRQESSGKSRTHSIGYAINALLEVRNHTGETLPIGDTGELHIYSDNLMSGYLGEPESGLTIRNGWLATGDQAQIRDNGEVILLGRLDNAKKNRRGEFVTHDPDTH
jgi:acyl-coenzyme A synthetase/AMP-(fatty) acid ligase